MSEPTTYDVIQDTRIKGVEDLVQTTYTPFQGPEFSYPVVHQPMDDEMWQYVTLGVGSGVLDVGGQPYHLRDLSDVTDTGKLTVSTTTGTAQALLRGFYHRLNQDMTLNFPPVSQKTIYQVVLEYDPLRHKEPGGPIRVRVLTSLDWSGGKNYLVLWKVERNPSQLLSQAAVQYIHPKITPAINVDSRAALPEPGSQLWGTRCLIRSTGEEVIAVGHGDTGPARWDSLTDPDWVEYPDTPTYVWPGFGYRRAIQRKGKKRRLRGNVKPRDGVAMNPTTTGYLMFTLADGDIPAETEKFIVAGSSNQNSAVVAIVVGGKSESDMRGEVRAFPKETTAWVSLSGVSWDV